MIVLRNLKVSHLLMVVSWISRGDGGNGGGEVPDVSDNFCSFLCFHLPSC